MKIIVDTENKEIVLCEDTNLSDLHEFIERVDSIFEYTIVLPKVKYVDPSPILSPPWKDTTGFKVNDFPFPEPVYCHPPVTSIHIPAVGVTSRDGYANSSDLSDK